MPQTDPKGLKAKLKKGEIDCMFPANITDYDAEKLGLILSPPLMNTEMDAVVRSSEQKEFLSRILMKLFCFYLLSFHQ